MVKSRRHDFNIETILLNSGGFHMRPAMQIADLCERFEDNSIFLNSSANEVDAKSIMQISMLAAGFGAKIKICVDGPMSGKVGLEVKSFIDTSLFEDECKSGLNDYIRRSGEREPVFLANFISSGNIKKGQPNDLFYWLKRSPRKLSIEQIAEELKEAIDDIYFIKKEPLISNKDLTTYEFIAENLIELQNISNNSFWSLEDIDLVAKDLNELQNKSNNGILTVLLERDEYQLLKFGKADLKIFHDSILDRLRSFDNEQFH